MRIDRAVALLLFLPVLAGCPGRGLKDKDKTDEGDGKELPPPTLKLVVAGIDPAVAAPDAPFDAEVLGTGFEKGARVSFTGTPASSTTFTDDGTLAVRVPAMPAGTYDVTVTNPDNTSATLRRGLTLSVAQSTGCPRVTVYFELDSSGIFPQDVSALQSAAACFARAGGTVKVEGHCDERGTTEYNLALGQRRADSAATVLSSAGVPRNRLSLVSYGEERPAATGSGEDAWSKNRRAVVYLED